MNKDKSMLARFLGAGADVTESAEYKALVEKHASEQANANEALALVEGQLAEANAKVAELTATLAEAVTKIEELQATAGDAEAAAAAAAKAEAELRVKARKEKLEAAVGTDRAETFLAAFEGMDDAKFEAAVAAMAGVGADEAKSEMFNETGIDAAVDAEKVAKEQQPVHFKNFIRK